MKTKNPKSYICPACGEAQTTVRQWQTVSIAFDFDLQSNTFSGEAGRSDNADHESFGCPSCGEDLPESITDKLNLFDRL